MSIALEKFQGSRSRTLFLSAILSKRKMKTLTSISWADSGPFTPQACSMTSLKIALLYGSLMRSFPTRAHFKSADAASNRESSSPMTSSSFLEIFNILQRPTISSILKKVSITIWKSHPMVARGDSHSHRMDGTFGRNLWRDYISTFKSAPIINAFDFSLFRFSFSPFVYTNIMESTKTQMTLFGWQSFSFSFVFSLSLSLHWEQKILSGFEVQAESFSLIMTSC
ncbi:hypothetical protein PanWU01x14_340060 [Parasponia andersonii]|uniref:Uncharacterized protein n=1 Tax=Parasponia andersonii TaxID=3476 RepID=A0A2P5AEI0_PARAD|nr:hypothetical protein PanWU01x14_340060 [Parasponia andersonii]